MCTSGQFLHRRVAINVQTRPGATGAVAVCDFFLYGFLQRRHGQAVDLGGLEARHGDYIVSANSLAAIQAVDTARLIQGPRAAGVALTQRILRQFGLDLPDQVLVDWQHQVFNRG